MKIQGGTSLHCKPTIGDAALFISISFYVLSILIVNPVGDFPLNDDWSYAATVRHLVKFHDWRPNGWTSMPLVTQSLWAWPFCSINACSFNLLRSSTLCAAVLLFPAIYSLIKSLNRSSWTMIICTILIIFNPILFELSFTFMTDVLFTLLLTLSTLLFLRSISNASVGNIALACVVCGLTTLCRQLALCLPAGFLFVSLLQHRWSAWTVMKAAAPLVTCCLVLFLFGLWMKQTGRLPDMYDVKSHKIMRIVQDWSLLRQNVIKNTTISLMYLGLFCLPALIFVRIKSKFIGGNLLHRFIPHFIPAILVVIIVIELYTTLGLMPIRGNVLVSQGLGPMLLPDVFIRHLDNIPGLPYSFWIFVTGLSLLGIHGLALHLECWISEIRCNCFKTMLLKDYMKLFFVLSVLIYLIPLIIGNFFERYIVAILPLVLGFIALMEDTKSPPARVRSSASIVLVFGFVIYGVLGTHDYLSWNRARWEAIADLMALTGADQSNTDGGFEFNGSGFDARYIVIPGKSWWWVRDDRYLVTFGPVPGYDEIGRVSYVAFLMPSVRYIFALRRHE